MTDKLKKFKIIVDQIDRDTFFEKNNFLAIEGLVIRIKISNAISLYEKL